MKQQNQKLTHVKHEFDPIFDEITEFLLWTSAEPFLESHCGTF